MKQNPTDISGARHVSTLKNTTYRDRVDEYAQQFGKKLIDESKIVERVSTYQRGALNQEERAFGGVGQTRTEMDYKNSKVELPTSTHTSKYVTTTSRTSQGMVERVVENSEVNNMRPDLKMSQLERGVTSGNTHDHT